MEHKRTKEQTINALKRMASGFIPSADCEEDAVNYCISEIAKDALALINELTEKNVGFKKLLDDRCDRCIERERVDTVRKMQKRLKERLDRNGWDIAVAYAQIIVDQIAKEMLEQ